MTTLKLARSVAARAAVVAVVVPSDRLKDTGVDKRLLTRLRFEGKPGQSATVTGESPAVTTVGGVAKSGEVTPTAVRRAVATAVRSLASHKVLVVDLSLVEGDDESATNADAVAQAGTEGAGLAAYRFDRYKSDNDAP